MTSERELKNYAMKYFNTEFSFYFKKNKEIESAISTSQMLELL